MAVASPNLRACPYLSECLPEHPHHPKAHSNK